MKVKVKKSITRRWLFNSFGVMAIILLIVEVGALLIVRNYYYSSVKQYMTSKMNIITSAVTRYAENNDINYNSEVRTLVETFDDKDQIELMAINNAGDVVVSSSGFSPESESNLSDYEEAKSTNADSFFKTFKYDLTGEKVMSYTVMIGESGSEYSAVRMVTSLSSVNLQMYFIFAVITVVVLGIIILIFLSGISFVRSIVTPISKITDTAKQFATGDFSKRIKSKGNDELGELCRSVNYMADELSNAEKIKNEFISQVSHELRTPLTAIKGWSETMETIDDRETFIKGMRVITSETERLSQMVEELLDFSRIQDGRLQLSKDIIDILAELGETVLIYKERARVLNITLNYYDPEMLPFIYGDKNRLRQVFINIVDNAIKYSDSGDTVSVEAFEDERGVVIAISDTGIGIKQEDLPKVKTKFFKANHTRRGSGIGLAVANEIISLHGGTLDINSEEGVGTTVVIVLPVASQSTSKEAFDSSVNVNIFSSEDERNDIKDDKQF